MPAAQFKHVSAVRQLGRPLLLCSSDVKSIAEVLTQVQRTLPQLEATCREATRMNAQARHCVRLYHSAYKVYVKIYNTMQAGLLRRGLHN